MKTNVLIDGGNMLHRAFYAFVMPHVDTPNRQYKSDFGYPTGMIYGPLSMLGNWLPDLGRFDAIHWFCDGFPARRKAADPDYKKRDRPDPMNSRPSTRIQLPFGDTMAECDEDVLTYILQLMGVSVYSDPMEEADDLIASFVRKNPDDVHIVMSSDKDFFQLLTNSKVAIYNPESHKILDAYGAEEHWATLQKGKHPKVSVSGVRMFKTLCGDPSDNIPGVPRLRKRIAAAISNSPTITLDELRDIDWPGFSDLERQRAREMFDRLKLNWDLVGLKEDLPVCPKCQSTNVSAAEEIMRWLNIGLSLSFLTPSSQRVRVSDAELASTIVDVDYSDVF